jgi:hypothetical protein
MGIVTTPITSGGAIAEAVVIQPTDGKIVVAGYTGTKWPFAILGGLKE